MAKPLTRRLGWLAALMLSVSPAAAQNLVTNGDFETGDLTGWATGGNWIDSTDGVGKATGIIPAANGGSYFLTLSNTADVTAANDGAAQVVQTLNTVAGQSYTLSAIWATAGGYNDPTSNANNIQFLNVLWDGATVLSESAASPTGWTSFTAQVTGTGSDALTIEGVSSNGYNGIDNVSVTAAPGPVAGAGLPALLGLLGYAGWRRRQQKTCR
jgi:MYXO-CTERM domain-containing protein